MITKSLKMLFSISCLLAANLTEAAPITSLTLTDIDGDGLSGLFTFGEIADIESIGIQFTGDTGIDMLWQGANQGAGVFTTGFQFAGQPFKPTTDLSGFDPADDFNAPASFNDGAVGNINSDGVLTISSLDFGGVFGGPSGTVFYIGPDAGSLTVLASSRPDAKGDANIKFRWSHVIGSPTTPSASAVASIQLEGVAHTAAVPLPTAAWLFVSGLIGFWGLSNNREH